MIAACPKTRQGKGNVVEKEKQRGQNPSLVDLDGLPSENGNTKKMSAGPTPPPRCPYATLGLQRSADASAIKRAFVEAAKRSHPDHLPSNSSAAERAVAAARFAAVAEAYEVLGDASKRAAFDRSGAVGSSSYAGGGYYRRSDAYNPYSGGFRPSSSSSSYRAQQRSPRPSSFLLNFFRLVAARSSRGDAWAHLALAAAALGGACLAATAGDDLWRAANRGKLFEDVVAERDRRRKTRQREEGERGSSAPCSASAPLSPEPAPPATSQTAAAPEASD